MNPRPNLELNPDKEALDKCYKLCSTHLHHKSKTDSRDKNLWRYVRDVCNFFKSEDNRTWHVSNMLSKAVVAARFERHSKNNGGLQGFHSHLKGEDLAAFQKIIYPAKEHGFDYKYDGSQEYRPGLKSEYLNVEYSTECKDPSITYDVEGVDSLLVKFVLPKVRGDVAGYTHRAHIVRVNYSNPHNLHVLYHKVVASVLGATPEVVQLLNDFEEQYLKVRSAEKLIKVIFYMYTQKEYKHNRSVMPKSVFVMNPSRRNSDHIREVTEEKKGEHGCMSKELADEYMKVAIYAFDHRMSVGPITGYDGNQYLGYQAESEDTQEAEAQEVDVQEPVENDTNELVEVTNYTEIPYINEMDNNAVATIERLGEIVENNSEPIKEAAANMDLEKLHELVKESRAVEELMVEIDRTRTYFRTCLTTAEAIIDRVRGKE
jgi:hypothetical protein